MSNLLLWLRWDPSREIFFIPVLNWPILWYSLLFVIGFVLGYWIFQDLLRRYFSFFPTFSPKDLIDEHYFASCFKTPKTALQKMCVEKMGKTQNINSLNKLLGDKDLLQKFFKNLKNLKLKQRAKKLCHSRFLKEPSKAAMRCLLEDIFSKAFWTSKKKIIVITDRLLIYMILATIIGARLGHFLFYESPAYYLNQPLEIFKTWNGGLSSHGAVVGILIALGFFTLYLNKFSPKITWLSILDLVAVPTAAAAVFIRLGNFFNQEIIGKKTSVPWAIIFMHPSEHLSIVPRHPTQLYEAFAYLLIFAFLYYLCKRTYLLLSKGKVIGLFLVLVFFARFVIEFFKVPQSSLISSESTFLMGQYLSIPVIALGVGFFFWKNIKKLFQKSNPPI